MTTHATQKSIPSKILALAVWGQAICGISLIASVLAGVFISPWVSGNPRPAAIALAVFVCGVTGITKKLVEDLKKRLK